MITKIRKDKLDKIFSPIFEWKMCNNINKLYSFEKNDPKVVDVNTLEVKTGKKIIKKPY